MKLARRLTLISLVLLLSNCGTECPNEEKLENLSVARLAELKEKTKKLSQDSIRFNALAAKLNFRDDIVSQQLIVKFKNETSARKVQDVLTTLGSFEIYRFKTNSALQIRIPSAVTRADLLASAVALSELKDVEYVHPNAVIRLRSDSGFSGVPNDPLFSELYGLNNTGATGGRADADIDAPEAWATTTGSSSVVVGVIDTGIDYTHPDLKDNVWLNTGETGLDQNGNDKAINGIDDDNNGYIDDSKGWDFVNNDNDPMDDNGHGTHVSGTIAASGNNGVGVIGVAWNVKVAGLKFLDAGGSGSLADAVRAVEYANAMGISITNNSWGGGGFDFTLYAALELANLKGYVFVAAAGNSSSDNDKTPAYPASYDLPNIISVAASDSSDALATFSSFGSTSVDIAAPGVDILSTVPGEQQYAMMSGTSMATPHVAGVVALIKSQFPEANPIQIKARLMGSSDRIPALTGKVASGGRLNANCLEVDKIAPSVVQGLRVSFRGITKAKIEFNASGDDGNSGAASFYDIRFSSEPILNEDQWLIAAPVKYQEVAAGSKWVLLAREFRLNTRGYISVRAFDNVGNISPLSAPVALSLLDPEVIFEGDANQQNGMVFEGEPLWGVEEDESRGKVLSDSPNEDYGPNAESAILLPAFRVLYPDVILSLATKISCEHGYDWAVIEYSVNNESLFRELAHYSALNCNWANLAFQLGDKVKAGDLVRLRFRFKTDDTEHFDGWLIDDIKVVSVPRPKAPSNFVGISGLKASLMWVDNSAEEDAFEVFDQNGKVLTRFLANQVSGLFSGNLSASLRIRACYGEGREKICSLPSEPMILIQEAVIQSISPNTGFSGELAIINLKGLNFSQSLAVKVGTRDCLVTSVSQFEAKCNFMPPQVSRAQGGTRYTVSVKNPQQQSWNRLQNAFLVRLPLKLDRMTPSSGPLAGGTLVRLFGQSFSLSDQVLIGNNHCTAVSVNHLGTNLDCLVPASLVAGAVKVTVIGLESREKSIENGFTYVSPPSVEQLSTDRVHFNSRSISPKEITISGKDFSLSGVSVRIGNKVCTVVARSTTTITCKLPNHAAGTYLLKVTNSDGQFSWGPEITYVKQN